MDLGLLKRANPGTHASHAGGWYKVTLVSEALRVAKRGLSSPGAARTTHDSMSLGDQLRELVMPQCSCHASCPRRAVPRTGTANGGFGLTFDVKTPLFNTLLALSRHNKTSTFSFTLPLLNGQQTLLVSGAHQRPKPNRRATRGPSRLRRPRAPRRTPRSPPPPPCPSTCRAP